MHVASGSCLSLSLLCSCCVVVSTTLLSSSFSCVVGGVGDYCLAWRVEWLLLGGVYFDVCHWKACIFAWMSLVRVCSGVDVSA